MRLDDTRRERVLILLVTAEERTEKKKSEQLFLLSVSVSTSLSLFSLRCIVYCLEEILSSGAMHRIGMQTLTDTEVPRQTNTTSLFLVKVPEKKRKRES